MLHFGSLPFVGGRAARSPPPPPPPALSLPGGSFIAYLRISMGVASWLLVTGVWAAFVANLYNGNRISSVIPMCTPRAIACDGPKDYSMLQMSLTLPGLPVRFDRG